MGAVTLVICSKYGYLLLDELLVPENNGIEQRRVHTTEHGNVLKAGLEVS